MQTVRLHPRLVERPEIEYNSVRKKQIADLSGIEEDQKQKDHLSSGTICIRQNPICKESSDDPQRLYHNVQ